MEKIDVEHDIAEELNTKVRVAQLIISWNAQLRRDCEESVVKTGDIFLTVLSELLDG